MGLKPKKVSLPDVIWGYSFKNKALLQDALTHPSAMPGRRCVAFERLEFLGDRVLGLVIAHAIHVHYPTDTEGQLAKRLSGLVNKPSLIVVAKNTNLLSMMHVGQDNSAAMDRQQDTAMADGVEALVGAIFLDSGLDGVQKAILALWGSMIENVTGPAHNAKTILQEWAQGRGLPIPLYTIVGEKGPQHAPTFTVQVALASGESARGDGPSRRVAEQLAAENLVVLLGL